MDVVDILSRVTYSICVLAMFSIPVYVTNSREIKQQREYEERVQGVCSRVEKKFDSNSNGMIDPDEAVSLARAVGYKRVFPTNQPITRLEPGSYSKKDIRLVLSSSDSYAEVHGIAASGKAAPAWSEEFRFPESRLARLSDRE